MKIVIAILVAILTVITMVIPAILIARLILVIVTAREIISRAIIIMVMVRIARGIMVRRVKGRRVK